MSNRKNARPAKPLQIGQTNSGLWKLGASRFDFHDPYHLAVSLSWPSFVVAMVALWLTINVFFALLYVVSPGDVVNARPGSFLDVFFFSIETLATVGYGVMAPSTLYGHVISALEIVTGTALTAIVTGLLFVRFSRPKAKILYADNAVVTTRNGAPTLMLRVANGRMSIMSSANVRLFVLLAERTTEGAFFRRVHELTLTQSHLPLFVMPWTLMHVIDHSSPLQGYTADTMADADGRLFLTIEARDQALAAVVQGMKNYTIGDVRFGMRFADTVTLDDKGNTTADLTRLSLLEADSSV